MANREIALKKNIIKKRRNENQSDVFYLQSNQSIV